MYLKRRKPTAKDNAVLLRSRISNSVLLCNNNNVLSTAKSNCSNADSIQFSGGINPCLKKLFSKFEIILLRLKWLSKNVQQSLESSCHQTCPGLEVFLIKLANQPQTYCLNLSVKKWLFLPALQVQQLVCWFTAIK